jgi:hypothetical protein
MSDHLKEKILALLDAMPKCQGEWVKGSGGQIAVFSGNCGKIATHLDGNWNFCPEHLPMVDRKIHPSCNLAYEIGYVKEAEELLFAVQERNIPTNAIVLSNYEKDNLLWLLTLVSDNYIIGLNTGDWVWQIRYKLAPEGKLTDENKPNRSIQDFVDGIIKNIIE